MAESHTGSMGQEIASELLTLHNLRFFMRMLKKVRKDIIAE
jgi:queuine/archaeosine tRNA-ribosyltransferase